MLCMYILYVCLNDTYVCFVCMDFMCVCMLCMFCMSVRYACARSVCMLCNYVYMYVMYVCLYVVVRVFGFYVRNCMDVFSYLCMRVCLYVCYGMNVVYATYLRYVSI